MTSYRIAGRSMIAFSLFTFVATVAGSVLFESLVVDVGAIIVLFLGQSVSGGSRKAARWSVAVMAYYLLLTASMLIVSQTAPHQIRLGGRSITDAELPAAVWFLLIAVIGSGVCFGLLVRALRTDRRFA
jgi:uncharacterized integral membrane protein